MEVELLCASCNRGSIFEVDSPNPGDWSCSGCGKEIEHRASAEALEDLKKCSVCGCQDLYFQKDFNRTIGISMVVGTAILSLAILPFNPGLAYLVLFLLAGFDYIIYKLIPLIVICYRCRSIHRGIPIHEYHEGFDLGIEEKYRRERGT